MKRDNFPSVYNIHNVLLRGVCGRAEHIFYYSQLFRYGGSTGEQLLCIHPNRSALSK